MTQISKPPTAEQFMRRNVRTVRPDMTLNEIIEFLLLHELSNAPVVDDVDGKSSLVGFLSERDCLAALSREAFFGSPAPRQSAATIMRRHPVCVSPDTELFALASIMVNHGFRHLPVTDDKTLLGIVSRRDILRAMNAYESQQIDETAREHARPDVHQLVNHRFLFSD
ncbi:MAG: CBS domain-containing protein [Fuerstiella sp.]